MNTFKTLAVASAALLITACATSATSDSSADMTAADASVETMTTTTTTTTQTVSSEDMGETVCKRQTVVGSRFHRKVCATRGEWIERERQAREQAENIQRNGRTISSGN